MKQSSIEWIYNNLKSHFEHDGDLLEAVKMSFEQAKVMHEEEIMEAHYADRYGCFSKDYYNETFNTNREMNQCKCTAPTIATKVSENGIYSYCTKCAEEVETFNTKEK